MACQLIDKIPAREWEGLTPTFVDGRFVLIGVCSAPGCSMTHKWSAASMPEPSVAVSRFKKHGWRTGRKVLCPLHVSISKTQKEKPVKKPEPARQETLSAPTDAAREAKRLAYMALESGYNTKAKAYNPGVSDASIAKEAGCSEAAVAKLREDMFGPLGEPAELAELRAKLNAALEDRGDLQKKFDTFCENMTKAMAASNKAIADLEAELGRLALVNGWKR